MARPRPEPRDSVDLVNRSMMCGSSSGEIPGPLLATSNATAPSARSAVSVKVLVVGPPVWRPDGPD
jgi:hypothetical protein